MSSSATFQLEKQLADFLIVQAIYSGIKLGLIELLAEGSHTLQQATQALQANPSALHHLMLLLAESNLLEQETDGSAFRLTAYGQRFQRNVPDSLYGLVMSYMELSHPAYNKLLYSVKTGYSGFEAAFQSNFYEYLARNPEAGSNFNQWMEASTTDLMQVLFAQYDFSPFRCFVDVGGNKGQLTANLLQRYPHLHGILFDLDYAVQEAPKLLQALKVADRCEIVGGNFFQAVPEGADLYMVTRVLFNWDDAHALQILQQIHASMSKDAKLVVVEMLLPTQGVAFAELATSLNLLALVGVLLRTEAEYISLLEQAGFKTPTVTRLSGTEFHLLETSPA